MSYINNKAEAAAVVRMIDDGAFDKASEARAISALREFDRLSQPSTMTQQASAGAKGFNVGMLADTLGAPVDGVNALLSFIGLDSEAPMGGSESIKEALVAGGMGYRDEQELPIDQRALARGGRTIGQATGMAAPIFGVASRLKPAQAAMQVVPKVGATASSPSKIAALKSGLGREASLMRDTLSNVVKSTARSPGQMAAIEGTSALGAGTFRAGAEAIDPGNEYLGMAAELMGGVAGPAPLMQLGVRQTRKLAENLTPSGRETAARKRVEGALQDSGFLTKTDPELDERRFASLAEELKQGEGSGMTVAQIVQDPRAREAFTKIENTLMASADDLAKQALETQNKNTVANFNEKINKLKGSGNPLVVKEAQQKRIDFFEKNLAKRVEIAEGKAGVAVNRVLSKNAEDGIGASAEARRIIDNELTLARKTEKQLWSQVDKSVTIPTSNLDVVKKFNQLRDDVPVEFRETLFPKEVNAFIKRVEMQPEPISAKELFNVRSKILDRQRSLTAQKEFDKARPMKEIGNSLLEDLEKVTDVTATEARAFSRSLNEKFNTKLINKLQDLDPTLFLQGAKGNSDAARAVNFQALKKATQRTVDTMEAPQATETLSKMQKDFMESAAASIVDTSTKQVKAKSLSDFIQKNELTLKEIGMLDDIGDVEQQVKLAETLKKTASDGVSKLIEKKKSLAAQLAGGSDDLSGIIKQKFDSKFQGEAFKDLARTVKRSNDPEALEGLRHAIFDNLLDKAKIKDGKQLEGLISGNKLDEILNAKSGRKTVRQNLLDSGLMTPEQSASLNTITQKAKLFEDAVNDPRIMKKLVTAGDGVMDVLARAGGSALGSMMALAKSSPLIMSALGAKLGRKVMTEVPALKLQGVLTEAIVNPKLMRKLQQSRPKAAKATDIAIRGYLLQAGLLQD
tara:strand:+ start:1499 stop:4240 length:2742 start_codon:yes stop_codon:yes gene_type:complete